MTQPADPNPLPPALPADDEIIDITADVLAVPKPAETRIDFERGMSPWPVLTLILIAANVGVFIWELAAGALASSESIIAAGALSRAELLEGQIWRLFTPMFLHGGIVHLLGNCVMLYILGMALEHALGWRQTLLVYFGAGLAGSVLSVIASPGPSVGASGAIFGLAGCVVTFLYRFQKLFFIRDKRIGLVLLIWGLFQIGSGFLDPSIDNFAHIGGFAGGAMLVFATRPIIGQQAAGGFAPIMPGK